MILDKDVSLQSATIAERPSPEEEEYDSAEQWLVVGKLLSAIVYSPTWLKYHYLPQLTRKKDDWEGAHTTDEHLELAMARAGSYKGQSNQPAG